MKRAGLTLTLVLAATLATVACSSSDIDNPEAVRKAMVEYLNSNSKSTGLDPNAMDVVVDAVAFERDVARATVSFKIKGTDQGMQMNYTLDRQGDKWVVKGKQNSSSSPHEFPSSDTAPPVPPGTPPPIAPGTPLPAGHPPLPQSPAK